jgi:AcrR family transcriptional regulator
MPRARLTAEIITAAGAALADDVGFAHLSMGQLAQRLGVKTPSLYKHVDGQADLARRIAALAGNELADTIRDATQGRSGRDALVAGAQAMRVYVRAHPGRYDAANAAELTGPDDPLQLPRRRLLASWSAMLLGYRLEADQEIHALRMLRSFLHGFSSIEAAGSFRIDASVDESFTWIIDLVDNGLRAVATNSSNDPARRA